ncbi:MAG TPA: PAS domain-containing protein, partial [Verrucomicrobiae bacterium]
MDTAIIPRPVRILHLEDNTTDHFLVAEMLRAEGWELTLTLATTPADFLANLSQHQYDLIISDYSMPTYDGFAALTAVRERQLDVPFLFFSGTIGEEVAVESLKHGAVDYVLKQHPQRLPAAIRQALKASAEKKRRHQAEMALRDSEERFRVVARVTHDVVWEWDVARRQFWVSPTFEAAYGHTQTTPILSDDAWFELIHAADRERVITGLAKLLATGGRVWWSEHRLRRADGTYAYVYDRATLTYDDGGKPRRMIGVLIDMSEQKRATAKIQEQAALLDKAQDAIIACNLDRTIYYWNKGAERVYGWLAAEAVGQNIRTLLLRDQVPPAILAGEQTLEDTGEWKGEVREYTKAGNQVTVQTRATLLRDEQGDPQGLLI